MSFLDILTIYSMTTTLVAKKLSKFLKLFLNILSIYSMKTTLVGKEFRKFFNIVS